MTDAIRFGLVGCGTVSAQHLEAIEAVEGARLTAVTSASIDRARETAERWGVPWAKDIHELLARDDVDAVAICTPSGLHAEHALAALRSGRHVVVEKPLALSLADADAIVAEAGHRGRAVATISQRRFEPVMQRLKAEVIRGSFGRMALIVGECLVHRTQAYYDSAPWRGTSALDGGVLMNQAVHVVDLMRWIGGPVRSVAAHLATIAHTMEAEDTASVSLQFANGAIGALVATTCAEPDFRHELRLYSDRGHVRIVGDRVVEWDLPDGAPAPAVESRSAAIWGVETAEYIRQYGDFVEAVQNGRPPAVSAQDGRDAVEIVTAAYESARTMTEVNLRVARGKHEPQ